MLLTAWKHILSFDLIFLNPTFPKSFKLTPWTILDILQIQPSANFYALSVFYLVKHSLWNLWKFQLHTISHLWDIKDASSWQLWGTKSLLIGFSAPSNISWKFILNTFSLYWDIADTLFWQPGCILHLSIEFNISWEFQHNNYLFLKHNRKTLWQHQHT